MAKNTLFSITGLTNKEAEEKRSQFGLNKLQTKKKKPLILLFFAQFCDLMILILLIAVNVAGSIGERRARKKTAGYVRGGK